jgi:hypothetical protein
MDKEMQERGIGRGQQVAMMSDLGIQGHDFGKYGGEGKDWPGDVSFTGKVDGIDVKFEAKLDEKSSPGDAIRFRYGQAEETVNWRKK